MGTVVHWQQLSPILSIFRLMPEDGSPFPGYKAGQYIALRRDDCRLTKRTIGEDGKPRYVPDLDEERNRTHATLVSPANGPVAVRVIPTNEELMIARSVVRVLGVS